MVNPITILIRTYNSAKTVQATLTCALELTQNQKYCCILVVDDGSTDTTLDLLKDYHKRISLITSDHQGPIRALNQGLEHVQTPYFTLLDSDDELPLDALKHWFQATKNFPDSSCWFGNYSEVSHDSTKKTLIKTKDNIFSTIAGGILFETKLVKQVGGYNPKMFFAEYDLLIRLMEKTQPQHIPELVYIYKRRHGSVSTDHQQVALGLQQLFDTYGKHFPVRSYEQS